MGYACSNVFLFSIEKSICKKITWFHQNAIKYLNLKTFNSALNKIDIGGRNPEIVSLVVYTMIVYTKNTITSSVETSLSAGRVSSI